MKRTQQVAPPRAQNQLLNILMLALIAIVLAIGDWLTVAQHIPWYFVAAVIVSVVIFFAVRRYNSRPM
ncbi:MAG TPA: hypothetical protein VJ761_08180 [Ktedonobacteraceae bacterium]|nr:hypothetical protein [Ktedonobacteraceae bacterium]